MRAPRPSGMAPQREHASSHHGEVARPALQARRAKGRVMSALPKYDPNTGLALEANWESHLWKCERCRNVYNPAEPASMARLCLAGAVLLKRAAGPVERPRRKSNSADDLTRDWIDEL